MNQCKPLAVGGGGGDADELYAVAVDHSTKVRRCRLTLSNPR